MRIFKRALTIIITLLLVTGVIHLLNELYDMPEDEYDRITSHTFYQVKDSYDMIFVGSSHVFCAIDPDVLEEISGRHAFNLSYSSMTVSGACFAVQEAVQKHPDADIFLDLYYVFLTGQRADPWSAANISSNWRMVDYAYPLTQKWEAAVALSTKEYFAETWIPFLRYRDKLFDAGYLREVYEKKHTEDYLNYTYHVENSSGITEFRQNGFRYTTNVLQREECVFHPSPEWIHFDTYDPVMQEAEAYVRRTIEYCKTHGTNLTLMSLPMHDVQLLSTVDYDVFAQYIRQIADEYAVPFYDFNLCRDTLMDLRQPTYFFDAGHLNGAGAAVFTGALWQVLSGETDVQDAFHASYREKLSVSAPGLAGVFQYGDMMTEVPTYQVASTRPGDGTYEYRITIEDTEGVPVVLQDFSVNTSFELTHHGLLRIEMRDAGTGEIVDVFEADV